MAIIKCPECKQDISEHAALCQHCGYKIPKKTSYLPFYITLIIGVILIVYFKSTNEKSNSSIEDNSTYTMNWREPTSAEIKDIGKIMIQNNIGGCGEYWVKETSSSEYVVACTADGDHWKYYVVYTTLDKIYLASERMELRLKPPR